MQRNSKSWSLYLSLFCVKLGRSEWCVSSAVWDLTSDVRYSLYSVTPCVVPYLLDTFDNSFTLVKKDPFTLSKTSRGWFLDVTPETLTSLPSPSLFVDGDVTICLGCGLGRPRGRGRDPDTGEGWFRQRRAGGDRGVKVRL